MLKTISQALGQQAGVADWKAQHVLRLSTQAYLIGMARECSRSVATETVSVGIYNDHPAKSGNGAVRGSSSLTLLPSDLASLPQKLREGVLMAELVDSPPFSLPGPLPLPRTDILDRQIVDKAEQAAAETADTIARLAGRESGVRLSAAEIFLNTEDVTFLNSRGASGSYSATDIYIEMVLLGQAGGRESEHYAELRRRRLADLDLEEFIASSAKYARDSCLGQLPASRQGAVVLTGDAVREIFRPLVIQTSGSAKFKRISTAEAGKSIFGEREVKGESLNLISDGMMPFGLESTPFDTEGMARQRLAVVENNVIRRFLASQQYADYLGIQATGDFANVFVPAGSTPLQDLLSNGSVYHIVSFSAFSPNPITGDFVAEIRLGYDLSGGTSRPIKGGALRGNVFDALANARYSQETGFMGTYLGPRGIRFEDLVVSGG